MRLTEARQGIRMLKFMDVFGRWEASELSQLEAAELLGMGERTFRRWSRRYEEEGEAGLLDRRIGKASGKRVPVDRCEEVEALYRTRYQGFTARHFHEHLVREHRFAWSYSWTRTFLQSRNLLAKAARRGAHRRKRPRRPLPGMMLHQDASRHAWLPQAPPLDLVVTMDDATSEVYSAFLVEEEGTASTFRALLEVIGRHGLPLSLYTDRGSHYFYTAEAGGKVDRSQPTQVGRALSHLGVEHIAAYSPQARGRSERLFQTLQDRLPKELALAGITTMDAANAWLRDTYIPAHNVRFAVKAEQEGRAFVAVPALDLTEVLCVQEERVVGIGSVRISVCEALFSLTHHWVNDCKRRVIVTARPRCAGDCSLVRLKRLFLRPDLRLSWRRARRAVSNPPSSAGPEPRAAAVWGEHGEDPRFAAARARRHPAASVSWRTTQSRPYPRGG